MAYFNHIMGNCRLVLAFFSSACLLLAACGGRYSHYDDILRYANKENGLIKDKAVGDISYKVKYIPRAYLVGREKGDKGTHASYDSLMSTYNGTYTFWVMVGPNEEVGEDFDIMTGTVANLGEYKDKVMEMNFEMAEYFKLNIGEKSYKPVCVEMENTYELSKHRKLMVGFVTDGEGKEAQELDLVFHDEMLGTGINHFGFSANDLGRIPKLERL